MNQELSFKNDETIKIKLIERMEHHIEMDELLQKAIGENGKGCTVWCALNNDDISYGYNHDAFPIVLGLPGWLARLQDVIFEGLSIEDAKQFSLEWTKVIPVGVNLEPVKWKFCAFILNENIERVLLLDITDELKKQVVDAIRQCLFVQENAIQTGVFCTSDAKSAAKSAKSAAEYTKSAAEYTTKYATEYAAAWYAAWCAVRSAVRSTGYTESAAGSSVESAESAAGSAVESAKSAAEYAVRSTVYKKYANKLIELLQSSK